MKPQGGGDRRMEDGDDDMGGTYRIKDVGNVVRARVELVEKSPDVLKEIQDEL
jgi:hypothetical protein